MSAYPRERAWGDVGITGNWEAGGLTEQAAETIAASATLGYLRDVQVVVVMHYFILLLIIYLYLLLFGMFFDWCLVLPMFE